jgi:hypothetical protein
VVFWVTHRIIQEVGIIISEENIITIFRVEDGTSMFLEKLVTIYEAVHCHKPQDHNLEFTVLTISDLSLFLSDMYDRRDHLDTHNLKNAFAKYMYSILHWNKSSIILNPLLLIHIVQ